MITNNVDVLYSMNKVKAYTWREGEIIMFFKMDYKYINKVLEKIWKMYHIQNGVIGQNYQIELLIYELSAKSKGDNRRLS